MYQLRCTALVDAPYEVVVERARAADRIRCRWLSVRHTEDVVATGAGALVTSQLVWSSRGGRLGRLLDETLLRDRFIHRLRVAHDELRRACERIGRPYAVGAAIMDDTGRVLAARRAGPPALAGKWEFPGGKLHEGETEIEALIRECREELAVVITPHRYLGEVTVADTHWLMRVWVARIVTGTPQTLEHDELRWVGAAELDALDWLPADRPLLPVLAPILTAAAVSRPRLR